MQHMAGDDSRRGRLELGWDAGGRDSDAPFWKFFVALARHGCVVLSTDDERDFAHGIMYRLFFSPFWARRNRLCRI